MGLRNVMSVVAQGEPRLVPPPNVSQERKIAYIESEINSLRKQFVDCNSLVSQSTSSLLISNSFSSPSLSQNSLNPPSFVLEPSLRPSKLIPHRSMNPSVSYHTAGFFSHSSVVATKMAAIYAAKGKRAFINVHRHFSPTPKVKHIRFTYSFDEDEDAECFGSGTHTGDAPIKDAIINGTPDGLDDSSQSDEF